MALHFINLDDIDEAYNELKSHHFTDKYNTLVSFF